MVIEKHFSQQNIPEYKPPTYLLELDSSPADLKIEE
jgi:hypothetical protein